MQDFLLHREGMRSQSLEVNKQRLGSRKGSGTRGMKRLWDGLQCVGSGPGIPSPNGPIGGTHMEEAIEDRLEDQEIWCVGAPWRALLGALLIPLLIVGVLIVLLSHPGPQRRESFPQSDLYQMSLLPAPRATGYVSWMGKLRPERQEALPKVPQLRLAMQQRLSQVSSLPP